MMILFKITFLLILAQNIFAQENYQLFKFSSNAIVSTKNVPEGFKLFVPDSAAQVLINPARGGFPSKFLYATYYRPVPIRERGSTTKSPSYSISYFNKNSLFRLETSPHYSDNKTTLFSESEDDLTVIDQDNSTKNKDLNFKLSIVDIGETANFRYAIGFTGILGNNQINTNLNLKSKRSRFFQPREGISYTLENNNNRDTDEKDSNKGYLLGMNLSMAGQDWDWMSTLNFQQLNINSELESRTFQSAEQILTLDPEPVTFWQSFNFYEKLQIEQSPSIFNLSSYLKKGDFFLNMDLSYAYDAELNYSQVNIQTSQDTQEQNEPEVVKSFSEEGTMNAQFFESMFAIGYVFSKQLQNLSFFTGINPGVSYQVWRAITAQNTSNSSSNQFVIEKSKLLQASIVTPLYLRYKVNFGLSIFGGLNYFTNFTYLKNSFENIEGAQGLNSTFENERTSKTFWTSRNFYLGASLAHKSGLVAHIDFNGNLSNLNIWNLSLGYHF